MEKRVIRKCQRAKGTKKKKEEEESRRKQKAAAEEGLRG
jgi:hypothetical protein